jgi:3-methyladenine DNA glycosylase AlkD
MTKNEIIQKLKSYSNPKNIAGMARFGINPKGTLGVPVPVMRNMAKEIGKDHRLALQLWDTKIHEARILASIIDDHKLVTKSQMDKWVSDFDSWDVCDQACMNLFRYTDYAPAKCFQWVKSEKEFIRRGGFVLIAALAFAKTKLTDKDFIKFFPIIKKYSIDERNFVRKAVNWALRQIGKRNKNLNKEAIKMAREIQEIDNKTAKWVANDALRELSQKKF